MMIMVNGKYTATHKEDKKGGDGTIQDVQIEEGKYTYTLRENV